MKFFSRIEWSNFLFITLSPIIAVLGTLWVFKQGGPHVGTWILFGVLTWFTGIGITAGYHRLFSHKSYQAHWAIRLFYILFGGASFQGSVREWSCAHRKHHQFVDTDRDPYNIKRGFWYAHVFWVVLKSDQSDETNIKDLKQDPLVLFQDRFYLALAAIVSFVLPAAVAALWGDFWGGFFVAGWLRVVINQHLTFLINSYAHFFGSQKFSDKNTARDNWLLAFFTYGEGFHNFHHAFASDYRNGIRSYDWDPAKWIITVAEWLGLASRLNRASPQVILAAQLTMEEKSVREKLARKLLRHQDWEHFVTKARVNLEQAHVRFMELKVRYQKLKNEKTELVSDRLVALRAEMQHVKEELNKAMAHWGSLIKGQLPVTGLVA